MSSVNALINKFGGSSKGSTGKPNEACTTTVTSTNNSNVKQSKSNPLIGQPKTQANHVAKSVIPSPPITPSKTTTTEANLSPTATPQTPHVSRSPTKPPLIQVTPVSPHQPHKLKISLNKDQYKSIRRDACRDEKGIHHTISFLGKTQAGKSTLLKEMMKFASFENDEFPKIACGRQQSPTSSGVTYFRIPTNMTDEIATLGFVDYEGENGNLLPLECSELLHYDTALIDERQRIAKHDLRRVAYTTSNVLVYITDSTLSNRVERFDCIREFASAAMEDISNAERPALIIVDNKFNVNMFSSETIANNEDADRHYYTIEEITTLFDCHESTESFFSNNDPERTMLNYFHDVKVVTLPMKNISIFLDEHETVEFNSNKLYQQQVNVLWTTIQELAKSKHEDRIKLGTNYNEFVWINLLKLLVDEFYHHVSNDDEVLQMRPIDMSMKFLRLLMGDTDASTSLTFQLMESIMDRMKVSTQVIDYLLQAKYRNQVDSCVKPLPENVRHRSWLSNLLQTKEGRIDWLDAYCYGMYGELRQKWFASLLIDVGISIIIQCIKDFIAFVEEDCIDSTLYMNNEIRDTKMWHQLRITLEGIYDRMQDMAPCSGCWQDKASSDPLCCPIYCDHNKVAHHSNKHMSDSRVLLKRPTTLGYIINSAFRWFAWQPRGDVTIQEGEWTGSFQATPAISKAEYVSKLHGYYNRILSDLDTSADMNQRYARLRRWRMTLVRHTASLGQVGYLPMPTSNVCWGCHEYYDSASHCTELRKVPLVCEHNLCHQCVELLTTELAEDLHKFDTIEVEKMKYAQCKDSCPFCGTVGQSIVVSDGGIFAFSVSALR